MNNRTICKVKNCILWPSLIVAIGCGDSTILEPATREGVIEKNIHPRISVDGENYKNAVLPFEQVTDDDIEYLADNHPNIRQIILGPLYADPFKKWKSVEQLTDESLRHLGRLRSLESINSLAGSSITDEGLAHLSGLENLDALDLRQTGITGVGLSHLKHLKELDSLSLPTSLTAEGIEAISTLQHVSDLSIFCNQNFAPLSRMESLDRLEILGVEVGTDYGWLSELTNLNELGVSTINEDVKRAFPFIGQMDRLLKLSISLPVTQEDILLLVGCESLEEIYFADCSLLTAEAVKTFEKMPRLKNLRLHGCQKELVLGLKPLANKRTLYSISLHDSAIDDDVLPVLSQFSHLRYLDLNGTQISEEGCRQLYKTLEERCKIKPSKGATLGDRR